MNDIKNLIETIEAYRNDDYPLIYPDDIMTMKELWTLIDYIHMLERREQMVIDHLSEGVKFCETDSQGYYDICNRAISREKKAIEILNGTYDIQMNLYEAALKGTELHKKYEESKKDKKILVFKCNCRLKPETKESLRLELKKAVEEGVVVLDSSFDHPIVTTLPKDCEYEIFVESLEEGTCE